MFPKHIFIDLDGTLFRSEEDIRGAWRATLAELRLDCPQFERVFRVGPSLQAMTEMLFPGAGLATKIVPVFKRHYDTSPLRNTLPYPGVDGWLRRLAEAGHALYTLTNKRLGPTEMLVRRHDWESLFKMVLGSDSFALDVPTKPTMLRLALERFGIAPATAAMVGDTPEDVAAGKDAGTFTVACDWGYASRDQLQDASPDVIISLSEILDNPNKGGIS
ncbi:MAG: HAD family hydrolase [Kiritimatiellae bacterium]|nr:HAD family hydrolase [Kiritimatiellia bacterium]